MPGSFSDYAESGIMCHLFLTESFSKPPTLFLALCGTPPEDTDTGALTSKELADAGAYARQEQYAADANWAFSYTNGSGTITNNNTITFPVATADWGWISGVAIVTSGVHGDGDYIIGGSLAVPKLIGDGDQFKMNAGDISLFLS